MASKYVNVCGKRIKYDSRFDFHPYCFFDLREDEYGMVLQVVDSILCRCHKIFKSSEVSSIKMLRMRNNIWECKVIFSISENERLTYEREVKDGKCPVCKRQVFMNGNHIYINNRAYHEGCVKKGVEDGK